MKTEDIVKELEDNYGYQFKKLGQDKWQFKWLCELIMDTQSVITSHPQTIVSDEGIELIQKHGQPYGIRNKGGFLFMFTNITKWDNQEERYRDEIKERYELADFLVSALQTQHQKPEGKECLIPEIGIDKIFFKCGVHISEHPKPTQEGDGL